jgi:hypothetical protein
LLQSWGNLKNLQLFVEISTYFYVRCDMECGCSGIETEYKVVEVTHEENVVAVE